MHRVNGRRWYGNRHPAWSRSPRCAGGVAAPLGGVALGAGRDYSLRQRIGLGPSNGRFGPVDWYPTKGVSWARNMKN
jgi:hypothetical protein